jgi:hypothetical protein
MRDIWSNINGMQRKTMSQEQINNGEEILGLDYDLVMTNITAQGWVKG